MNLAFLIVTIDISSNKNFLEHQNTLDPLDKQRKPLLNF